MHQQTVSLLSFKPLPKDIYDAQVAFNLLASLGSAAKTKLETARDTIRRQIGILSGRWRSRFRGVAIAPGSGISRLHRLGVCGDLAAVDEQAVHKMLLEAQPQFLEDESPSNELAAGKGEVLVRVTAAESKSGSAFWLWMAADNLRLSARNATACALELVRLKPTNRVQ